MRPSLLSAPLLALLVCTHATAAPPTVTSLFPAGAQRGQSVEVIVGGTFDHWPVQVWADDTTIQAKAGKDKGRITVTVAGDATPGTHWLRFFDEQGASTLRAFVVGNLPETTEREPNDDAKKPQPLDPSSIVVNGKLEKPGDVDCFAVTLKKGQTLVASLLANRVLGSPMDGHLQVLSPDGFVLEENNDYHGLDPQIIFTAPADGAFLVRTFAFPAEPDSSIRFAGAPTYIYRLTLTTGGFVDHAFPLAVSRSQPGQVELVGWNIPDTARRMDVPKSRAESVTLFHPDVVGVATVRLEPHSTLIEKEPNDRKTPQTVTPPLTVSARMDTAKDVDVYRFEAKKGQRLDIRVEAQSLGSPLDAVLLLTDDAGKMIQRVDDVSKQQDPSLAFTAPADGAYRIEVRDLHNHGGMRYVYRLRIAPPEVDYDLTLAEDRLTLTAGKPLEVPITVARRNGFEKEVVITVEGLPEGVTAEPLTVTGAKPAMLRLTAKAGAKSGAIRIIGTVKGNEDLTRTARPDIPALWLTVRSP